MTTNTWDTLTPTEQFAVARLGTEHPLAPDLGTSTVEYGKNSLPTVGHLQDAAEYVAAAGHVSLASVRVSYQWDCDQSMWFWQVDVEVHSARRGSKSRATVTGYSDHTSLAGLAQAADHAVENITRQREMGHIR